jgi:hypothetical protein
MPFGTKQTTTAFAALLVALAVPDQGGMATCSRRIQAQPFWNISAVAGGQRAQESLCMSNCKSIIDAVVLWPC